MRSSRALCVTLALVPGLVIAQAPADNPAVSQYDPKEWEVPYGGRPRDPYADQQGRVWFVGQAGNYIAYVDSKSGSFKRFEIDSGTHPHNLVIHDGNVWFTGNRNGRIVKLDPNTGKLTNYMIPDSTVRDPHTMIIDSKTGVAWFTAQRSTAVGRLDTKTGQFRVWKTGARTNPYGIVLDSKGNPWFDLFGTNKIGTIDAKTLELKEYPIPNDSARPRRIAITTDDQIYWGDYTRGYLGHLDPKTGQTQEWVLPLGVRSRPYAMTTDDRDVIWVAQNGYNGTPAIPSTLVGFDHKTKKFVAEIPVGKPGNNTIRHMTFDKATRQIWFGTDQGNIGKISVPKAGFVQ